MIMKFKNSKILNPKKLAQQYLFDYKTEVFLFQYNLDPSDKTDLDLGIETMSVGYIP